MSTCVWESYLKQCKSDLVIIYRNVYNTQYLCKVTIKLRITLKEWLKMWCVKALYSVIQWEKGSKKEKST